MPRASDSSDSRDEEDRRSIFFIGDNDLRSKGCFIKPKTKICDHWRRSGHCAYGESCWYAHGQDDLRKHLVNNNPKPQSAKESWNLKKPESDGEMIRENDAKAARSGDSGTTKTKRASTNVKNLTVNIPTNINTAEQSALPLSPAQERWISMSQAGNEKSDENSTLISSTSTIVGSDQEKENDRRMQYDRRAISAKNEQDMPYDFSNVYPSSGGYSGRMAALQNSNQVTRSYGRGPTARSTVFSQYGNPNPHTVKASRSNAAYGYQDQIYNNRTSQAIPSSSSRLSSQSSSQNQALGSGNLGQYPNLVDEIYRRQKIIAAGGKLEANFNNADHLFAPNEQSWREEALLRQLYGNDMAIRQGRAEIEARIAKEKELKWWKQQDHHTHSDGRHHPNSQQGYPYRGDLSGNNDCSCGGSSRSKPTYQQKQPYSRYHHQQHQPYGVPMMHPTKADENMLPYDETFSIWLDLKPKKETMMTDSREFDGRVNPVMNNTNMMLSENDCQVEVNSLMDLLSKQNLLENSSVSSSEMMMDIDNCYGATGGIDGVPTTTTTTRATTPVTNNTMFDFDMLKMDEMVATPDNISPHSFFVVDANTPYLPENEVRSMENRKTFAERDQPSPSSFNESCYFYSTAGTCPFGDSCQLAHTLPNEID